MVKVDMIAVPLRNYSKNPLFTFLRRSVIGSWELYSRKISLLFLWIFPFRSFFSSGWLKIFGSINSLFVCAYLACKSSFRSRLHWPLGRFKLHLSSWQIFMQIGCESIMITLSKSPTFFAKTWAFRLTFRQFKMTRNIQPERGADTAPTSDPRTETSRP